MRVLYTLPNLHETKENRGTVVEEGGSLVDKSDSCFWKTEGRRGGWKEEATAEPKQETPPSRWAHKDQAEGCPGAGECHSQPPDTGHRQVITELAGRGRPHVESCHLSGLPVRSQEPSGKPSECWYTPPHLTVSAWELHAGNRCCGVGGPQYNRGGALSRPPDPLLKMDRQPPSSGGSRGEWTA